MIVLLEFKKQLVPYKAKKVNSVTKNKPEELESTVTHSNSLTVPSMQ